MRYSNTIELEIRGERALFRDPQRLEPLPVPSFGALCGILNAIYWNPAFLWIPDSLRVMNEILFISEGARIITGKRTEMINRSMLYNVSYQLRAHFVWNEQRPDLADDRDENKHFRIALRSLSRGGRRNVFLGSTDCPAEVRSVHFGSGNGAYDSTGAVSLGRLYHSFDYSAGIPRYCDCIMDCGVISFAAQELFPHPETESKEVSLCRSC